MVILRVKYEDLGKDANAARGVVNGKQVNFFLRVQVDEMNIVDAIQRFRGNKWVVALDYIGDPGFLQNIDISGVLVIVIKEVMSIESLDIDLQFMLSQIDPRVRVVLKLPKDFNNMKVLYDLNQRYPNLHFCGGYLLRIDGCNIGCIGVNDLFKKVPSSRISLITEGCGCVLQTVTMDDVGEVEFYYVKPTLKEKIFDSTPRIRTAPKKRVSSLLELSLAGKLDNF